MNARAHDHADLSVDRGGWKTARAGQCTIRLNELRQAEVQDFWTAILMYKDVLGLQVSMDDPLVVRRRERLRDQNAQLDRLPYRQWAALQFVSKGLAFE
jgi:hypothetical protein